MSTLGHDEHGKGEILDPLEPESEYPRGWESMGDLPEGDMESSDDDQQDRRAYREELNERPPW